MLLDTKVHFISRSLDMEDSEGKENADRENDWEVVSLTASAYAIAPGPKEVGLKDEESECANGKGKAETSNVLFMSDHFIFPPSQHENLPLEPDADEVHAEICGKGVTFEDVARPRGKVEECWSLKGLATDDDFPGIILLNEKKIDQLPFERKQFGAGTALQVLSCNDKQESIYTAAEYSFFNDESLSTARTHGKMATGIIERNKPSEGSNLSQDVSQSLNIPEDEKDNCTCFLPCGAWWKRRAASLYTHAKEANAFWSIFIAAAVMGLVMIGQRWQQERWVALHVKGQIRLNNEVSLVRLPKIRFH